MKVKVGNWRIDVYRTAPQPPWWGPFQTFYDGIQWYACGFGRLAVSLSTPAVMDE